MCRKLHGGCHAALHFLLLSSRCCIKTLYKYKLVYEHVYILFSVIESVSEGPFFWEARES